MAFANLFTKLSDVNEAETNAAQVESSHRHQIKDGQGGPSRKRKCQSDQAGSYLTRQHFQQHKSDSFDAFKGTVPKAAEAHRPNSKHARSGFSREVANSQSKGQRRNPKKKNKGKKKQENSQRYRNYNKDRRGRSEYIKEPPKQIMTQEFKDQNAVEADGHLFCSHFLRGKCIKGEECQLEHIEGYNNIFKEVCKFYVQGFCLKGNTCPYMHQSFPCKFFHKKGYCKRDDCRFSHDPLNDFTQKLLDDAIKQEDERLELNKKAEKSLSQSENVPHEVEENPSADIIVQPIKPNFYTSSETNIEEEPLPATTTKEDVLMQIDDNVEHDKTAMSDSNNSGPVCYSVEAVLGPQFYKPFFYTAPGSQESPLSMLRPSCESTPNPKSVPYSVDNVLRSKSDRSERHSCAPLNTQTPAAIYEVKDGYTNGKLDNKYNISHWDSCKKLQEKTQGFHVSAASGYCNKESESIHFSLSNLKDKRTLSPKQCDTLSNNSSATNQATPDHLTLQGTNNEPKSLVTPQTQSIKKASGNRLEAMHCSNLAASNKTNSKPFQSLFASLVPDTGQPPLVRDVIIEKLAAPGTQGSQNLHCKSQRVDSSPKKATKPCNFTENTTKSTNTQEVTLNLPSACSESSNNQKMGSSLATSHSKKIKNAAGSDQMPAKSFLNLFAAPLCKSTSSNESKVSCLQEPALSVDCKQLDVKRTIELTPDTSSPEKSKTRPCYQTEENANLCRQVSSTSNSSNKTTGQAQPQPHNGPPGSVLRTLFQHLRPYEQQEHQDHVKTRVHSENKTNGKDVTCGSGMQQKGLERSIKQ